MFETFLKEMSSFKKNPPPFPPGETPKPNLPPTTDTRILKRRKHGLNIVNSD